MTVVPFCVFKENEWNNFSAKSKHRYPNESHHIMQSISKNPDKIKTKSNPTSHTACDINNPDSAFPNTQPQTSILMASPPMTFWNVNEGSGNT